MIFNYPQICQNLLKDLPGRQKEVILRRYGLTPHQRAGGEQRETLESIGRAFGVTRERVRQIEEDGFLRLKPQAKKHQKAFQYFAELLKTTGDLRKEEILLSQLGGKNYQPQVFFLLTLGDPFKRFSETKDLYSLWTINPHSLVWAQKVIDSFYNRLREVNRPLTLGEFKLPSDHPWANLRAEVCGRFVDCSLEISKIIQKNSEGLLGLKDWPEINPRGVKDKAYLVFKKEKRPLHFTEVADRIASSCLPQTVHNELIKDQRFALVGRGIYALKEWGYEEGQVKDIILKVLKEARKPLSKEKILEKTLKQRLVKENTILLNLSNKKYFLKDSQGKYILKEK